MPHYGKRSGATCHYRSVRPLPVFFAVLCVVASRATGAPSLWAQGDPTAGEQYAMEWLNAARADPAGTLARLIAEAPADPVLTAYFAGEEPETPAQLLQDLQTAFGLAQANSAAYPNSAAIDQEPWVFYPLFQTEAAAWGARASLPNPQFPADRPPPAFLYPPPQVDTLLSGAAQTFSGPDATGGTAVFGPYGGTYAEVSQANLYTAALTGREYVLSLLCQPGSGSPPPPFLAQGDPLPNLTLGHTRMAGVALTPQNGGGQVLTVFRASDEFLTQDDLPFGPVGTVFITGVAYRDQNANAAYDPGEGLAGVSIGLDRGNWAAVTASAGGYAIPVPANSGTYTLTANGGPFAGATATVNVGSDNVKLDWVAPASIVGLPPQQDVPAGSGATQLVNLSARGRAEAGANPLTAGFVIAGPVARPKRLLIRGVGPSLQSVGFPAAACLPATQLRVFASAQQLAAENAGWTTAPDGGAAAAQAAQSCGAFALTDWAGGGGDSALVVALAPGAYTAVVVPAPGAPPADQTGKIGLIELYDLSPSDGNRLVNLSCRGTMGSGAAGLILGVTVAGTGQDRLLIRAAGPALAAFGVSPTLSLPALTLYDAAGQSLAVNAGWYPSAQTDQISTLGAQVGAFPFPAGSADAALIRLFSPGCFTATVTAAAGAAPAGAALAEVYEAD